MPAACTSRATSITSITWSTTAIRRNSATRTSFRLWKAEKWDPDRLMQLYKKAGAKYFVSMGSHHDNFFLWNSKLHRGTPSTWARNATSSATGRRRRRSMGCGSASRSTWAPASPGSRAATARTRPGRKAGVPYDGADPKWQDLYHFPAEPGDKGWYSKNPKWQQQWYNEIKELVDNYHPDLLYSDGGVAFGNEVGPEHDRPPLQQRSPHGGNVEVVYNCKQKSEGRWVEDLERGIMPKIDPYPWQTDTSIGDWFYNRNWKFRPVSWVIHMLVDNVSKNGNLLLNVVQRPDGSLDPEVEQMLAAVGRVERDPRRSHLRHAALAGLRRKRGQGQGRPLQGGITSTPPRKSASPPKGRRSMPSRWAGRRTASSWSSPSPSGRQDQQFREPAGLRRQSWTGSRPPRAWS